MIVLPSLAGQKWIILGLGKSGFAAAQTLTASHADFIVWDDGEAKRQDAIALGYNVQDPTQIDLTGFSGMIVSPAIPLNPSAFNLP